MLNEVAQHIENAEALIKNFERWNGEESRKMMIAHYAGVMAEAQAESLLALTKQLMILTELLSAVNSVDMS